MDAKPPSVPRLALSLAALVIAGCVELAPTPVPTPRPTATPTPPPSVPTAPVILDAYGSDASATVEWITSRDGGSHVLYHIVSVQPGGRQIQVPGASANAWTVTGLSNGTEYTFAVAAANRLGEGPFSAPSPPVVPTPLRVVSERSGTFQLGPLSGRCINRELVELQLRTRDVATLSVAAGDDVQVSFHTPHGDIIPIGSPRTAVHFERVAMIDGLHTLFVESRWRPEPALPCERQLTSVDYFVEVRRHAPR